MTKTRTLTILAFAAIYLLWGSTFLAIRIAVESVPPLFAAGVRFALAGSVLYGWARWRGGAPPTRIEWRSVLILAIFLFLIAYGGVFWAERSMPSGIVSVLVSTIPLLDGLTSDICLAKGDVPLVIAAGNCPRPRRCVCSGV